MKVTKTSESITFELAKDETITFWDFANSDDLMMNDLRLSDTGSGFMDIMDDNQGLYFEFQNHYRLPIDILNKDKKLVCNLFGRFESDETGEDVSLA